MGLYFAQALAEPLTRFHHFTPPLPVSRIQRPTVCGSPGPLTSTVRRKATLKATLKAPTPNY